MLTTGLFESGLAGKALGEGTAMDVDKGAEMDALGYDGKDSSTQKHTRVTSDSQRHQAKKVQVSTAVPSATALSVAVHADLQAESTETPKTSKCNKTHYLLMWTIITSTSCSCRNNQW